MDYRRQKAGFTLIELLVVIAIIGLLSSIVLVSLNRARMKARDTRRMADLKQMQLALEMYYNDNGTYPVIAPWISSTNSSWNTLQTALAPYMAALPKDPKNSAANPWNTGNYSYAYGSGGSKYDLVTQLEDTGNANRCEVKCWKYHEATIPSLPEPSWCGYQCPPGMTSSPYIYADH